MSHALYEGWVHHRRHSPRAHAFSYRLFMVYLDLDRLDEAFAGRWLWSAKRPALAWFRRADYYGDATRPLALCIREAVSQALGRPAPGPVHMLTHLRYFGFGMNPITLYYCFEADGVALAAVVAEVHNTPWNEKHLYVWPGALAQGGEHHFEKAFHVSPFMPLSMEYHCRFSAPGDDLEVHLENWAGKKRVFEAGLVLRRGPLTARTQRRALYRFPLMTVQVFAAIYYEAFRLWWKRTPYYPHSKAAEASMKTAQEGKPLL